MTTLLFAVSALCSTSVLYDNSTFYKEFPATRRFFISEEEVEYDLTYTPHIFLSVLYQRQIVGAVKFT